MDEDAAQEQVRPQHAAHSDRQQRRGQGKADPKAASHVAQFGILLFASDHARLQSQAANGATPRLVSYHFGMHRAGVFGPGCGCRRLGIERHPTLRARPRAEFPNLRAHWTDVGACVFSRPARRLNLGSGRLARKWHRYRSSSGSAQRHQSRSHGLRRRRKYLFRTCLKLCHAPGRAEEILFVVMEGLEARSCGLHLHPADGIFFRRVGGRRRWIREIRRVKVVHSLVAPRMSRARPLPTPSSDGRMPRFLTRTAWRKPVLIRYSECKLRSLIPGKKNWGEEDDVP